MSGIQKEQYSSNLKPQTPKLLDGRTVLVTRARIQAEAFARAIGDAGGNVLFFPVIEIVAPDSWLDCDTAIRHLHSYDFIVFTSANAVEKLFERTLRIDGRGLSTIRQKSVYAVGEMTRRSLELRGCKVIDIPEKSTAEDLGRLLKELDLKKKKVLLPRGELSSRVLPTLLRQSGATVDEPVLYNTRKPEPGNVNTIRELFLKKDIDVVTFFSPSSVRNFAELISIEHLEGAVVAVIGEVTAEAAQQIGIRVDVIPAVSTGKSMVESLGEFFSRQTVRGGL